MKTENIIDVDNQHCQQIVILLGIEGTNVCSSLFQAPFLNEVHK